MVTIKILIMISYKKKYLKHFNYGEQDHVPCEVCASSCNDIHHIDYRSLGGSDDVENLMALCRYHHDMAHAGVLSSDQLQEIHNSFMQYR